MKKTPDPTLAERIAGELSRRIISGALAAGQRLRQDDIARDFAASHVPVREAFRRLEAEGLVEVLPRRGVRVAAVDPQSHFETVEMRAVLEGLALRHAAGHFPPRHLLRLAEVNRVCSDARSPEDWEAANRDFHRLLLAPCPMPRLMQSIERLQAAAARSARMLAADRPAARPLPREDQDHRAILAALHAGDPDLAAALLTRHIRRGSLPNNR